MKAITKIVLRSGREADFLAALIHVTTNPAASLPMGRGDL